MQDILGPNSFFTDSALRKCNIFGQPRIKVVTRHGHIEVFIEGVYGERVRRVGR